MEKTLIGNNGYLFLKNDDSRELEVHCNNLCLVVCDLSRFQKYFDKYYITVFPDKSYLYKKFLPSEYISQYRPGLLKYKSFFNDKLFDTYDILKNINDPYYKTDTHINLNGAYNVYVNFIKNIKKIYNLNLPTKHLNIKCYNNIILSNIKPGLGDLTLEYNRGTQILDDISDNYYYSDDLIEIYNNKNPGNIIFLDKKLEKVENISLDTIIDWNIISKFILYKKNKNALKKKVVIYYDSFITSTMGLYITMFYEVYMIKDIYCADIMDKINPDYIFEFRIERFLF
jgi:hypothetical protein